MKVKIVKCSAPKSWYANLVGEVFDVELYNNRWYFLTEDIRSGWSKPWRGILIKDAETQ